MWAWKCNNNYSSTCIARKSYLHWTVLPSLVIRSDNDHVSIFYKWFATKRVVTFCLRKLHITGFSQRGMSVQRMRIPLLATGSVIPTKRVNNRLAHVNPNVPFLVWRICSQMVVAKLIRLVTNDKYSKSRDKGLKSNKLPSLALYWQVVDSENANPRASKTNTENWNIVLWLDARINNYSSFLSSWEENTSCARPTIQTKKQLVLFPQ
jgi:hypothetical protein